MVKSFLTVIFLTTRDLALLKNLAVLSVSCLNRVYWENRLTSALPGCLSVYTSCLETRTLEYKFKYEKVSTKSIFMTHFLPYSDENSPRHIVSIIIFGDISDSLRKLTLSLNTFS